MDFTPSFGVSRRWGRGAERMVCTALKGA